MAGEVNATTMRVVIQSVKEVSGRQFEPLLHAAGMARFITHLPPDDLRPAADGEELVRLFHVVYGMLGESCTRLFHRNCGVRFAEGTIQGTWGRTMLALAPTIPVAERSAWFVHKLAEMAERSYSRQTVSEDDQAWYLSAEICHVCLGLTGIHAPLCASAEVMYALLGDQLAGRHVRVVEVECAAMGAPHCKYAIYK